MKSETRMGFNLDGEIHRLLKAKAAMQGKSLQDFVRELIRREVGAPAPRSAK